MTGTTLPELPTSYRCCAWSGRSCCCIYEYLRISLSDLISSCGTDKARTLSQFNRELDLFPPVLKPFSIRGNSMKHLHRRLPMLRVSNRFLIDLNEIIHDCFLFSECKLPIHKNL